MSEFNIEVQGGSSVRLPTAGKYCEKDIIVTASGGGGTEELENLIDESGVLGTTDETVTVTDKVKQLLLYSKLLKFDNALSLNENFDSETIDYYLNFPYVTNIADLFRNNKHIKKIKGINTAKVHNLVRAFLNSTIEEIELPFDLSGVTSQSGLNGTFQTTSLKEIRFVQETIKFSLTFTSPVLSIGNVFDLNDTENVGSVQSIINGLITLAEGATAQTLTLSKNLPLTDEQKQAITTAVNNKGWTLAFA